MQIAVQEFSYDQVLSELKLTADEFVDMCILCGCDYTDKIPGIGPVKVRSSGPGAVGSAHAWAVWCGVA